MAHKKVKILSLPKAQKGNFGIIKQPRVIEVDSEDDPRIQAEQDSATIALATNNMVQHLNNTPNANAWLQYANNWYNKHGANSAFARAFSRLTKLNKQKPTPAITVQSVLPGGGNFPQTAVQYAFPQTHVVVKPPAPKMIEPELLPIPSIPIAPQLQNIPDIEYTGPRKQRVIVNTPQGDMVRVQELDSKRFIDWEDLLGAPLEFSNNPTGVPSQDFPEMRRSYGKFAYGGDISIPNLQYAQAGLVVENGGMDWEGLSNPELLAKARAMGHNTIAEYRNSNWGYGKNMQQVPGRGAAIGVGLDTQLPKPISLKSPKRITTMPLAVKMNTISNMPPLDQVFAVRKPEQSGIGQFLGNPNAKAAPLNYEEQVNEWLGKPMDRAYDAAERASENGSDPVDNFRHPVAGMYTQQAIKDKVGIPIAGDALGFLGANAMGIGHEAGTLFRDDRPWNVKLREAGEDAFNNFTGSLTGLLPGTQEDKENILYNLSAGNWLPDGVASNDNRSMYFKDENGNVPRTSPSEMWGRLMGKKQGGAIKRVKIDVLPKAQNGMDWESISNPELARRAKAAGWNNVEQYRNANWAYNTTPAGTPKANLPIFPTRVGPTKEAEVLDNLNKEQLKKYKQYDPKANPEPGNLSQDQQANSPIGSVIEFLDPTGIMSYDDAKKAYHDWKTSGNTIPTLDQGLSMFSAVPALGKLGKVKYAVPMMNDVMKTAYKYFPWQQALNLWETQSESQGNEIPDLKQYGGTKKVKIKSLPNNWKTK